VNHTTYFRGGWITTKSLVKRGASGDEAQLLGGEVLTVGEGKDVNIPSLE